MKTRSTELEESQSATAVRMIVEHWFSVLEPPPRMTVSEWAEEYRFLSPETCSNPGKYSADLTPWAIEWMDGATDPEATGSVLMVASQLGKTESLNNVVGYFIHIEPATILVVQPTEGLGEQWSKERLEPMIRDTPVLCELVAESKTRNSGNTIAFKSYPGGNIAIAGANAPSGLAGRPRRVVLLDEEDRYPMSAGKEGDPASLAIRRTETFYNAVVFETSTPTVKGLSRIEARFEQSDKRRWWVQCPHAKCSFLQVFAWPQIRWTDPEGKDAWYECAGCKAALTDADRRKMSKGGRWIAEHPDRSVRGYHLNGIASLFRHKRGYRNRLHQMVAGYLEAKAKGIESYRTWVNTFLAETYEEEGEKVEWEPLMKRREAWGDQLPVEVAVITTGVDFQGDRIEGEHVGWNEAEESWSLGYFVIIGDPENKATLAELDRELNRKWTHPSGVELGVTAAMLDSGHKTKAVYGFTRARVMRRIFAVKGKGGSGMPILSRPRRIGSPRVILYTVGTDTAKDSIYSRLALDTPGPGYCHFPADREEDWFKQLTAEQKVTSYVDGKPFSKFVNPSKARNEALDCRVYATAGLAQANPNWKKIRASLAMKEAAALPATKVEEKANTAAKAPRRSRKTGGGFATSW